jgi:hydrogenase-4 component B
MAGWIALTGVAVLALGTVVSAMRGHVALGLAGQAAGVALLGAAGGLVLVGGSSVGSGFRNTLDPAFGIDGLSGFFLLALALTAAPALVFAVGYLRAARRQGATAALTGLFVLVLAGLVCARDLTTFLVFWELATLVPAAAILVEHSDRRGRRDAFAYVAITHLAGVGVWLAFLVLAQAGAIGDGSALAAEGAGTQVLVALAAIVGFGTKAGLMPGHVWLPRAHPQAPSHVSALMSGMMIKVALYGLVRVLFEWLGATPLWLGMLLLGLGLLSSVGGVLYALFQHELKRLLAFHSIENVGIIVLALGASMVFASEGLTAWASVAFAAALLHTLNHALFKSLLFLGAGAFERAVHGLELDRLGGLLRRMPWTGGAFVIGAMAIAGLPPLNGFASEWLTLQSLLHLGTTETLGVALAGLLATAGLAATAALAVYCFVKVVGLVLLGPPRRPACAAAREAPVTMRAGVLFLAGVCGVLGLVPGLLLPELTGLAPEGTPVERHLGLSIPGTGGLGTVAVAVVVVLLASALVRLRGRRSAASAPTWACGQAVEPALAWTSAGFTKPLRLILEAALRPRRTIVLHRAHGVLQGIDYEGEVPHHFETALYRPVIRRSLHAARIARRVQSGSLRLYVAALVAVVLFALVLARAGVLG